MVKPRPRNSTAEMIPGGRKTREYAPTPRKPAPPTAELPVAEASEPPPATRDRPASGTYSIVDGRAQVPADSIARRAARGSQGGAGTAAIEVTMIGRNRVSITVRGQRLVLSASDTVTLAEALQRWARE